MHVTPDQIKAFRKM